MNDSKAPTHPLRIEVDIFLFRYRVISVCGCPGLGPVVRDSRSIVILTPTSLRFCVGGLSCPQHNSAKVFTESFVFIKAKLRFELETTNFQSVSGAQGLYLTALLVYICLAWAMFLGDVSTLQLEGLNLKTEAIWKITPFVTMVLKLAVQNSSVCTSRHEL